MNIKYRFDVINLLIDYLNYYSYLEIGVGNRVCFDKIHIEKKLSVDPSTKGSPEFLGTSDDFFKKNKSTYDIIFIDGLHCHKQVRRDITNSLSCLNNNGTIVLHDVYPLTEIQQYPPDKRISSKWTGDVWREWVRLRATCENLNMFTVLLSNKEETVGIIRPGKQEPITLPSNITYNYFDQNRESLLNIISPEKITNNL